MSRCRHCGAPLEHVFVDLGFAPASNAYLDAADLAKPEIYYPLKLYVCTDCWLVHTKDYRNGNDLFDEDYAYFSSVSKSGLEHAASYVDMIRKRLNLGQDSLIIE